MPDKFFYNLFKERLSLSETLATYLNLIANLIVFLVLGFILFRVIRYVGRKAIHKIADKTGTQLDDMLIKNSCLSQEC